MTRLDQLPHPSPNRLAVTVSRDALRQIRGGHPWVFDSSIRTVNRDGEAGDLAVVFGDKRQFVAIGLYDPLSPIRIRILHVGKPTTIDSAFWRTMLDTAFDRRGPLWTSTETNGFRCVHGENDGLPGLVVDRYDSTLVVKIYTEAWMPHMAAIVPELIGACADRGATIERVVLRTSRLVRRGSGRPGSVGDGDVLVGPEVDGPVVFRECGLLLEADVVGGQKTGHFLDQRDNRLAVRGLSNERRVLDVFACTGGFSLNAAAGGALEVLSVDQSERSLATAERNFALNADLPAVAAAEHRIDVCDAFAAMTRLLDQRRQFELVIVDPPSFASKGSDRDAALAAYARLAQLAIRLTAPRGTFVQSSCSSRVSMDDLRSVVTEAAVAVGRPLTIRSETAHPIDHPIGFAQGAYLKTIFSRVGAANG